MRETPHSWIVPTDPYESSKNQLKNPRNRTMAFKVRICPECNRVHEKVCDGNSSHMVYYNEFPRYKLGIKSCDDCNG